MLCKLQYIFFIIILLALQFIVAQNTSAKIAGSSSNELELELELEDGYLDDRFLQAEYLDSRQALEDWRRSLAGPRTKPIVGQRPQNVDVNDWDLLIFTQQWPVTTCMHWREHDKTHPCRLPKADEFWTIHGIWPTKYGHFGPSFCNRTAQFNATLLQPIADQLNFYWPDLDGSAADINGFWRHEYLKHGTCAAQLPAMDSELKYFDKALSLRKNLLISDMLDAADIHPDSTNTIIAINDALNRQLGVNPSIHCVFHSPSNLNYLSEVRICLDKAFQLIDCNGIKLNGAITVNHPGGQVVTNCHIGSPVYYPSTVPPTEDDRHSRPRPRHPFKFPYVDVYKLVKLLTPIFWR